jgi:hypothetical protein
MNAIGQPHTVISPRLSCVSWVLWLWGVPAMAVGFFLSSIPLLTAGAVALEAAALLGIVHTVRAARFAFRARPASAALPDRAAPPPTMGNRMTGASCKT